jgi:hypothetical protein
VIEQLNELIAEVRKIGLYDAAFWLEEIKEPMAREDYSRSQAMVHALERETDYTLGITTLPGWVDAGFVLFEVGSAKRLMDPTSWKPGFP